MSGSNGVQKFAEVNRDDQIINLKTRGGVFETVNRLLITGTSSITAEQYVMYEIVLDATTPSVITLDTLKNIFDEYAKYNKIERGSSFRSTIINNDPTTTKTLTLPTNMVFFESGASSIAIPPNTRIVLFNEITAITGTPTIVVYADSFSGMSYVLSTKQGAIACPIDYGNYPYSADATEQAFWTFSNVLAGGTGPATGNFWTRGLQTHQGGAVGITFPLKVPSKLSTNTISGVGFVVTSIRVDYLYISQTNELTVYADAYVVNASASGAPVSTHITNTSSQPTTKPATSATGTKISEVITLSTPFQVTDNTYLHGVLQVPQGGFPNSAASLSVYGCVFYGTYQYST